MKGSATDWIDGGWDVAQSVEFARELKLRGAGWVTASSGGISPQQKIAVGPNYQLPFAEAVKQGAAINTIAVGLITEAWQAEEIVATGKADIVALARVMLYDPRWPWRAAAQLGATVEAPPP
jgi:NADPH2 dehydrogenase